MNNLDQIIVTIVVLINHLIVAMFYEVEYYIDD